MSNGEMMDREDGLIALDDNYHYCPECRSLETIAHDGMVYEDETPIGFKFTCQDCGHVFCSW